MRSTVARSAAKLDKGSTGSIRSSKRYKIAFEGEPVGQASSQIEFASISNLQSKSQLLPPLHQS